MKQDNMIYEEDFYKPSIYKVGRTIYFFEEINSHTVGEVIRYIDDLEKKGSQPISIILNSPGGEEYSGLALYDRIRSSKCEFTIVGMGLIASMALIVYTAGDKRVATVNARFMNHQGSTEIGGKATDIKIESKEMDTLEDICIQIMSERTNQDPKKLKNSIKIGNKYMSAKEAKKFGFVHEIIDTITKRTLKEEK